MIYGMADHHFSSLASLKTSMISFIFLICSLHSLHSFIPFIRSLPSHFSLFPFTFLLSLLSFLLTLSLSRFTSSSPSYNPYQRKQPLPFFSLTLITTDRCVFAKSFLLSVVFLLRFQALRYCNPGVMILAELSGDIAARFVSMSQKRNSRGWFALFLGLVLLSISWDRAKCFPVSAVTIDEFGLSIGLSGSCLRFWTLLLPFVSGFLWIYERNSPGTVRKLGGQKNVNLISLFLTTIVLFFPAVISVLMFEEERESIAIEKHIWPLLNIVVFGVVLHENFSYERMVRPRHFPRKFVATIACIVMLELFYISKISVWGFLICGSLLGIAAMELDSSFRSNRRGFGLLDSLDTGRALVMKSISVHVKEC